MVSTIIEPSILFISVSFHFHFISFHIISYHFISFHIISYHSISFHIISYHFISFHIISYHFISFHIISLYSILFLFISPSTSSSAYEVQQHELLPRLGLEIVTQFVTPSKTCHDSPASALWKKVRLTRTPVSRHMELPCRKASADWPNTERINEETRKDFLRTH